MKKIFKIISKREGNTLSKLKIYFTSKKNKRKVNVLGIIFLFFVITLFLAIGDKMQTGQIELKAKFIEQKGEDQYETTIKFSFNRQKKI